MKIKITTQMLEDLNACQPGIDDFERITGGKLVCEWTLKKQIELLKTDLRKWFGWATYNKLLPAWSMSGADLSGADLSWADLSGANLTGADLSWADLSWANLSGANLTGADLSGADLSWANLSGANLTGADLSGADLTGANLFMAISNVYTIFPEGFDRKRLEKS